MYRRRLFTGLCALLLPNWPIRQTQNRDDAGSRTGIRLEPSGPVISRADGQIIENLDIVALSGAAVQVLHRNVTVRNCRIQHAAGHGIHGEGAAGLVLQNLDVSRVVRTEAEARPKEICNNIHLNGCGNASLRRIRASRGSSNIYIEDSEKTGLRYLELHDACGPFPRGQNVQFNHSPRSVLEDFSGENGPSAWTEDNVSVFRSDDCTVRRGLVVYNNSPTGDGVMIEGSFNCLVEDVDAVQQGNGAFAAVPEGNAGSGGCTFHRCRTCASYNEARDGREAPSSDGLSFYVMTSENAPKHRIIDCHYYALANPHNLLWNSRYVAEGGSLTPQVFTPRRPVRLSFGWQSAA